MISVLDHRVPARGRTPDRLPPWVSARSVGDPLLVGLVALVVYALHGMQGYLEHDLGVFVYGGEHVARGIPPYTGVFNSVGPLADAVPGLAIGLGRLVGVAPVPAARILFLLLSVACVVLVQVLARDTYRSRAAGFVAAAVFLTFTHFIVLAADGPREKTTMVLALLGCLVFLGRRRLLAAGVCTALATLTWQPALAPAVAAAAAVVLLLPRGERVRRVGRVRGRRRRAECSRGGVVRAHQDPAHGRGRLPADQPARRPPAVPLLRRRPSCTSSGAPTG